MANEETIYRARGIYEQGAGASGHSEVELFREQALGDVHRMLTSALGESSIMDADGVEALRVRGREMLGISRQDWRTDALALCAALTEVGVDQAKGEDRGISI